MLSSSHLVVEKIGEGIGSPGEPDDILGQPARLYADRDLRRHGGCLDQHERVAPWKPRNHAELVAADEHHMGADASTMKIGEQPASGVGFVREPDLHVFDIARDPRIAQAGVQCGLLGDRGDTVEPGETTREQALFDRREQLSDPRLGRIRPLRLRNQVDLSPVQPVRDDLRAETVLGEPGDRRAGRCGQRLVLGRRRHTSVNQLRPLRSDDVDLRSSVETEVQDTRSSGSRHKLPVDVVDVRATDDADVEPA